MKKLLLFLFIIISSNLNAQYITFFSKNADPKQSEGVYYYLPRNVIAVNFIIEQTQEVMGKYVQFAKELLGTDNYIKENKIKYTVHDIIIESTTEPDPNMVFFVSLDEKSKEENHLNFTFSEDGIIHSFGHQYDNMTVSNSVKIKNSLNNPTQVSDYQYILNSKKSSDYFNDSISLDNLFKNDEELKDEDIAKLIIEEINNIRQAYFDLISGYQEVNYGSTINDMAEKLLNLEKNYLSLFIGKSTSNIIKKTVYLIPETDDKNDVYTVGYFSDSEGFKDVNFKGGEPVKIHFQDLAMTSKINILSKDEIENASYANKLFYRIPGLALMKVIIGDKIISENRIKIAQLGGVTLVPMNKMKLVFDHNTGQIISISKE